MAKDKDAVYIDVLVRVKVIPKNGEDPEDVVMGSSYDFEPSDDHESEIVDSYIRETKPCPDNTHESEISP